MPKFKCHHKATFRMVALRLQFNPLLWWQVHRSLTNSKKIGEWFWLSSFFKKNLNPCNLSLLAYVKMSAFTSRAVETWFTDCHRLTGSVCGIKIRPAVKNSHLLHCRREDLAMQEVCIIRMNVSFLLKAKCTSKSIAGSDSWLIQAKMP